MQTMQDDDTPPSPPTLQGPQTREGSEGWNPSNSLDDLKFVYPIDEDEPLASLESIENKIRANQTGRGLDHWGIFERLPLSAERKEHVLLRFLELETKRLEEEKHAKSLAEICPEKEA